MRGLALYNKEEGGKKAVSEKKNIIVAKATIKLSPRERLTVTKRVWQVILLTPL